MAYKKIIRSEQIPGKPWISSHPNKYRNNENKLKTDKMIKCIKMK
jgi:hypothetical protein